MRDFPFTLCAVVRKTDGVVVAVIQAEPTDRPHDPRNTVHVRLPDDLIDSHACNSLIVQDGHSTYDFATGTFGNLVVPPKPTPKSLKVEF